MKPGPPKGYTQAQTLTKAAEIKAFIDAGGMRRDAMRKFHCGRDTLIKICGYHVRPAVPVPDGPVKWTPNLTMALIRAWNQRPIASMTAIARELRVGKNHVAGKVHRLRRDGVLMAGRGSPIRERAQP